MGRVDQAGRKAEEIGSGPVGRAAAAMASAAFMLMCTGCVALVAGAAAGAGGAVYVMGKLKEELNHPVPIVHKAAVAGTKDLGLSLSKNVSDKVSASLESEFADGKHIWIDLESVSGNRTEVTIRVGYLGDEVRSREILQAIKKRLA